MTVVTKEFALEVNVYVNLDFQVRIAPLYLLIISRLVRITVIEMENVIWINASVTRDIQVQTVKLKTNLLVHLTRQKIYLQLRAISGNLVMEMEFVNLECAFASLGSKEKIAQWKIHVKITVATMEFV